MTAEKGASAGAEKESSRLLGNAGALWVEFVVLVWKSAHIIYHHNHTVAKTTYPTKLRNFQNV